jgi:large subunit ribosomal protein L27
MSKTKASGTTSLGRDSRPKYLGIKASGGQPVKAGMIIVKQRGTKVLPGKNVKRGSDDTLYAVKTGVVKYTTKRKAGFNNQQRVVKIANVE